MAKVTYVGMDTGPGAPGGARDRPTETEARGEPVSGEERNPESPPDEQDQASRRLEDGLDSEAPRVVAGPGEGPASGGIYTNSAWKLPPGAGVRGEGSR